MPIRDFEELRVYQAGYAAAMKIFKASRSWPAEERYALTDQICRSSRAVCSNIAEAWSKRRYERHFISKLSDAEGEAAETITWIDFAKDCGYLSAKDHCKLRTQYRMIRGGLVKMMAAPEKWCGPSGLISEPDADYTVD
jgi:four helix bundle protein